MVSATKIGSMPSQLVGVLTEHLPEHMPELHMPDIRRPELPASLDDVTDRLRNLGEAAGTTAKRAADTTAKRAAATTGQARSARFGLPLILLAVVLTGVGVFFLLRSRRSTTDVGSTSSAESYART